MDKLLLSLSFIVLLMSLTVNSAPMPSSKLISSIDQRHKKNIHSTNDNAEGDGGEAIEVEVGSTESVRMQKANKISNRLSKNANEEASEEGYDEDNDNDQRREGFIRRRDEMLGEARLRQNKMIGFYPFNAVPFGYPAYTAPVFYPQEFYDDFASFYGGGFGEDEELMSRASPSNRRRPASGSFKNSPIFYIRLPPTPYMFVPGLGYISQPPTYTPMTPAPPVPQPISPFYNLPLDFISNGKPTNIYQWGSPAPQFNPQPQYMQPSPQYGAYPSYQQRPQRPYGQRPPQNPYPQESKVTNLKGPFLFNGRPEEIFVLRNSYNPSYNSLYSDPRLAAAYY